MATFFIMKIIFVHVTSNLGEIKMSFENDFKRMWEPIESTFHGVLIEKLRKKNFVPFQDVLDAWENEKKNWLDPMRIQNSFLRTMEQRNPAYAKDFHDLIKNFSFQKDISRELPRAC